MKIAYDRNHFLLMSLDLQLQEDVKITMLLKSIHSN